MKYIVYKFCFIIGLLTAHQFAYADQYNPLSSEDFNELSSNIDYTKDMKRQVSLKEFKSKPDKDKEGHPLNLSSLKAIGSFINILAYLLIIVLVCAILYFLISNVESGDNKITYEDKMTEEEDIEDIDAHHLYLKALIDKDYRTAIRMRFIIVLQEFSERELINWKPEKTNRDYKREIKVSQEYSFFESASNIYDRIWYGNVDITLADFEKLNPYFELKSTIS